MSTNLTPTKNWFLSHSDIIANIANSMPPVQRLITGAAYLMGIAFAFKAIYALKAYGEARTMMSGNTNIKEPLIYLIVAGIFIYLPTAVSMLLMTTFGQPNLMGYESIDSKNSTINSLFGSGSPVGRPLALIIQTIGIIAFVRGWVLIARASSQGQPAGGTGKGLMHVFGGILAMNIIGTLAMINKTLYG